MGTIIHIGAGAIGLGFIGELAKDLKMDLVLIHRERESDGRTSPQQILASTRGYTLCNAGGEKMPIHIKEICFYRPDGRPFLGTETLRHFCSPDLQIVTTAVKFDNMKDAARVVAAGLIQRTRAEVPGDVLVVACENADRASSHLSRLVDQHFKTSDCKRPENIHFADCVIDRICQRPELTADGQTVLVSVAERKEWILDLKQVPEALQGLLAHRDIHLVSDFEPYVTAKKWFINGLHICAAVLGASPDQPVDRIRDVFLSPALSELLEEIAKEMQSAFLLKYPGTSRDWIDGYRQDSLKRLRNDNKPIQDILADLRVFSKLSDFKDQLVVFFARTFEGSRDSYSARVKLLGSPDLDNILTKYLDESVLGFLRKIYGRLCQPARELIEAGDANGASRTLTAIALTMMLIGQEIEKQSAESEKSPPPPPASPHLH